VRESAATAHRDLKNVLADVKALKTLGLLSFAE
jgi:predicted transcriptional regulator